MTNNKSKYTLAALSATSVMFAMGATNVHAAEKIGEVTVYSLNIRSGPSTSSNVIGGLKKGDRVTITSSQSGWYQIKYGNKTGWISGDYVEIKNSANTNDDQLNNPTTSVKRLVATAGLNVRSGGSTSYKVIGYIPKDTSVEVIGVASTGWYEVKLSNGTVGYASNSYLKESSTSSENSTNNADNTIGNTNDNQSSDSTTSIKRLVATAGLNVRSGGSTSYKVIGYIPKDTSVEVIGVASTGWYKVKLSNGTVGYASNSYLKEGSASSENTTNNTIGNDNTNSSNNNINNNSTIIETLVATANLNLRSGPSTSYGLLGVVYKGDTVSVIEHTSNYWYKVKLSNGKVGYCSSTYLKSQSQIDSATNKPTSDKDIAYTLDVKSYAYYTGTITATGTTPTFGRTIAVDPTIIPYGTRIYIPEFDKTFIAEDCGGGIKGNKIDIYMNTKEECINWGVRNITLYILK